MAQTFEDNNSNNNSRKNLQGLWANPRSRTMILIMGGLVVAMLVVGFLSSGGQKAAPASSGTQAVSAPSINALPGTVVDRSYQQAVKSENEERLHQAQQSGKTVLPTLEAPAAAPSLDPLANAVAPATAPPVVQVPVPQQVTPQENPSAEFAASQKPAQQNATASSSDISRTERYKQVQSQLQSYMKSWVAPTGNQEFAFNGQMPKEEANTTSGGTSGAGSLGGGDQAQSQTKGAQSGPSFVRAGTIVPAVLLSALNSETPGPVLAQITSGPLAGARLLGTFQSSNKQIVVQFRTLSMPSQPHSFSVNAYAVNGSLGTGLATSVNNHYLRRYGLLLAAGFVQGYGQAIGREGTTTAISDTGSVIVTQDQLSSGKITKVALGQAGSTVAGDIQREARIAPTVKVEGKDGAGVPIGLLFMSDF